MNDDPTTFSTVMGMVMHAEAERARQEERAAVVAWLRAPCGSPGHEDRFCADCNVRRNIGDAIKRGEHRREEGA